MVKPAVVLLVLSLLVMACGASMLVSTGTASQAGAPGEGGREGGGEDTHMYSSETHKWNWITREDARTPEPPLLNVVAFAGCMGLVALIAVVVIRDERKAPPVDQF
jgi:hypothetical protein